MLSPLTACVHVTGRSCAAAVLLYRICWWQPRAKIQFEGQFWIAKTREEWCAETGLSLKQYKDALTKLTRLGLVQLRLRGFGRGKITHLRLTEEALTKLKGLQEGSPYGPKWDQHTAPNGTTIWSQMGPPYIYKESNKESNKEDCELTLAGDHMKSTTHKMKDVTGLLSKNVHKAGTVAYLESLWREGMLAHQSYVTPWTMKERGQAKQLIKLSPSGHAGDVLKCAVERWEDFVTSVKTSAGLLTVPVSPSIGFVLKHTGHAVDFWQESGNKPVGSSVSPVPKPKEGVGEPVLSSGPKHEKADLEDVMAILKTDD